MEQADFQREYLKARRAIFAYIRASGFSIVEAEDLEQEVAMRLWKGCDSYVPEKPFVAWATGVAKNVMRNKWRYDRVRAGTAVDSDLCERIGDCVGETLETLGSELEEEKARLEACLRRISKQARHLLGLRYVKGWNLEQIADHLGRTYGAVNVTLSRVRRTLRKCVRNAGWATG